MNVLKGIRHPVEQIFAVKAVWKCELMGAQSVRRRQKGRQRGG